MEGLRRAVLSTCWDKAWEAVGWVLRGCPEICRVEIWVNVKWDTCDVVGEEIAGSDVVEWLICRRSSRRAGGGYVWANVVLDNLQVRVAESCVAEAIAEFVHRVNACAVECAVVNEDAFGEVDLRYQAVGLVQQIGPVIFSSLCERKRQLGSGVDLAVEDVDDRVATLFTGDTGPKNGSYVGV